MRKGGGKGVRGMDCLGGRYKGDLGEGTSGKEGPAKRGIRRIRNHGGQVKGANAGKIYAG